MVWGLQGHAPSKISTPTNPHGSQLLWAPTNPMFGVCSTCQQAEESFEVRVETWNLDSLREKGG